MISQRDKAARCISPASPRTRNRAAASPKLLNARAKNEKCRPAAETVYAAKKAFP